MDELRIFWKEVCIKVSLMMKKLDNFIDELFFDKEKYNFITYEEYRENREKINIEMSNYGSINNEKNNVVENKVFNDSINIELDEWNKDMDDNLNNYNETFIYNKFIEENDIKVIQENEENKIIEEIKENENENENDIIEEDKFIKENDDEFIEETKEDDIIEENENEFDNNSIEENNNIIHIESDENNESEICVSFPNNDKKNNLNKNDDVFVLI